MKFQKIFQNWQNFEEFSAGSTIFSSGEPADALYFIYSGEVELSLHGVSLGIEKPGNIIGEMAMMESARQNVTANAISDLKLARIDRNQLKDVIKGNNSFSVHVMSTFAKRLRDVDLFITQHIAKNTD